MWLWIFIFGVINENPYMKKLELLICLVMFMIASAKADVIESELQKSRMDNGFIACTSIVKKQNLCRRLILIIQKSHWRVLMSM